MQVIRGTLTVLCSLWVGFSSANPSWADNPLREWLTPYIAQEKTVPVPSVATVWEDGKGALWGRVHAAFLADRMFEHVSLKRRRVLAISLFSTVSGGDNSRAEESLGELLVGEFCQRCQKTPTPAFDLLERSQLEAVLQEQRLSLDDLYDGKQGAKVGKLLGAELILVGKVTVDARELVVNWRFVDLATGAVAWGDATGFPRVLAGDKFKTYGGSWPSLPWMRRDAKFLCVSMELARLGTAIRDKLPLHSNLAILPFPGVCCGDRAAAESLRELLISEFSPKDEVSDPDWRLVERSRLDSVLAEQKLELSDLFDGAKAAKIGKLVGADLVLVGKVVWNEDEFVVVWRFIDVKTGRIQCGGAAPFGRQVSL